jgi:apyrase
MQPDTEQHKRNLCFDAWYMWVLLTCAIGFKENDLKRLSFANRFPTGKVGWTLGYMINQTNYIPAEYRKQSLTKNSFIGWLTGSLTFALILLIFLLLTCYINCKQKTTTTTANNKDNYGHLNDQELT